MWDIMKRDKPPNKSGLLIKSGSETIENEAKEHKRELLRMLLGTLGASLLKNLLAVELSGAGERTTTAAADAEIHKKNSWFGNYNTGNFKQKKCVIL